MSYDPNTGAIALVADPKAIADVSQRLVARLNERLAEQKLEGPVIPPPAAKAAGSKGTSKSGLVMP